MYYIEADVSHFRYWIDAKRELNGLFDNALGFTNKVKAKNIRSVVRSKYPNVYLSIIKK